MGSLCRRPPVFLFTALLLLAAPLFAQDTTQTPQPTLRVSVRLVSVFVSVTDSNGALVGGLDKENFRVTEDSRPQTISVFERQTGQPLNLTLAIDTSGSVRKDLAEETSAARHFSHAILRPQDRMSVLEFSTLVRELSGFTNKQGQIDRALGQLRSDSATALYEAIRSGSERLGTLDGRRVLVLVSDGGNTVNNATYDDALQSALHNEIMIYALIDVPIEASAGRNLGGEHALITLAEQTGGRHFYVADGNLDQAYRQLSDTLRTQYLIGYYPHNQDPGRSFHRIHVTVPRATESEFNLRHKTGYFTEPAMDSDD